MIRRRTRFAVGHPLIWVRAGSSTRGVSLPLNAIWTALAPGWMGWRRRYESLTALISWEPLSPQRQPHRLPAIQIRSGGLLLRIAGVAIQELPGCSSAAIQGGRRQHVASVCSWHYLRIDACQLPSPNAGADARRVIGAGIPTRSPTTLAKARAWPCV